MSGIKRRDFFGVLGAGVALSAAGAVRPSRRPQEHTEEWCIIEITPPPDNPLPAASATILWGSIKVSR